MKSSFSLKRVRRISYINAEGSNGKAREKRGRPPNASALGQGKREGEAPIVGRVNSGAVAGSKGRKKKRENAKIRVPHGKKDAFIDGGEKGEKKTILSSKSYLTHFSTRGKKKEKAESLFRRGKRGKKTFSERLRQYRGEEGQLPKGRKKDIPTL